MLYLNLSRKHERRLRDSWSQQLLLSVVRNHDNAENGSVYYLSMKLVENDFRIKEINAKERATFQNDGN